MATSALTLLNNAVDDLLNAVGAINLELGDNAAGAINLELGDIAVGAINLELGDVDDNSRTGHSMACLFSSKYDDEGTRFT